MLPGCPEADDDEAPPNIGNPSGEVIVQDVAQFLRRLFVRTGATADNLERDVGPPKGPAEARPSGIPYEAPLDPVVLKAHG